MSYDISLYLDNLDTGGPEPITYCVDDIGNYTSNVAGMWDDALGHRLADLNGKNAGDSHPRLAQAVANMHAEEDRYRAMNPRNGWGGYDGALDYLTRLRDACAAHPKARIYISH